MSGWLSGPPAPPPPDAGHVQLEALMGQVAEAEGSPAPSPAALYIRAHAPKLQLDKWGEPLPLSAVEQDRLDRMFAVLASPYERTMALMRSGLLGPDEVDAVQAVHPEIYALLVDVAKRQMMESDPPYGVWAESMLSTLFGKPAAKIYGGESEANPEKGAPKGGGKAAVPAGATTQADRRDADVRQQRSL